jgi:uncharacterized protein (TIRG00374 family)
MYIQTMTQKQSEIIKNIFKFGMAGLIIYWLIAKKALDLDHLGQVFNPQTVIAGLVLIFAALFINNYRWFLFLNSQGIEVTIKRTLSLSLIGTFFNYAVPGGVGGDFIKGYYLVAGRKEGRLRILLTILFDRAVGLYSLIFMATLCCFLNFDKISHDPFFSYLFKFQMLILVGLTIGFLIAFWRGRQIAHRLNKIHILSKFGVIFRLLENLQEYGRHPILLGKAIFLSFLSQALMVMVVVMVGLQLGFSFPLSLYFFLVPLGICSGVLPISPAGVGVGQAFLYLLFTKYQPGSESVGTVGITAIQILTFAWGLVGAFLFMKNKRDQPLPQPEGDGQ